MNLVPPMPKPLKCMATCLNVAAGWHTTDMWLFTRYGFLSVVTAEQRSGDGSVPDEPLLMVRARVRQHVDNLQRRFPSLCVAPIIETPEADYLYRAIVPMSGWAEMSRMMAEEIDYSNFKGVCEANASVDEAYVEMLHGVWQLHYGLQQQGKP